MKIRIVLTVAVVISAIFLIYAKMKAGEAVNYAKEAQEQAMIAKMETERAEQMAERAQLAAAEARTAQADAMLNMERLKECQNGK